jgi:hypothetical protein
MSLEIAPRNSNHIPGGTGRRPVRPFIAVQQYSRYRELS